MKRWTSAPLLIPVLFFALGLNSTAISQDMKIGYVFTDEIREKVSIFQENQGRFEEEASRLRDDVRNVDQEIKRLKTELTTQSVWISDERKQELESTIQERVEARDELARNIFEPDGRIDQLRQQLTGPVVARMLEVIQTIGKNDEYTMIIDLSPGVVLYYEGLANLTDIVVQELNKAFAAETTEPSP